MEDSLSHVSIGGEGDPGQDGDCDEHDDGGCGGYGDYKISDGPSLMGTKEKKKLDS